jgi:hypothetical protein
MRCHIPSCDIYRTAREDGHRGETAVEVKKRIPHRFAHSPPSVAEEEAGVCIPNGNIKILLAAVNKSSQMLRSDTDITQLLRFRTKSILAGDLNVRHTILSSKVSNSSGLKVLELFVSSNFEISTHLRCTHSTPDGRDDVHDTVVRQNIGL